MAGWGPRPGTSTGSGGGSGGTPAATVVMFNLPAPLANTEYSYPLPANTKQLHIKSQTSNTKLRIAFAAGDTLTNYSTVFFGNSYDRYDLDLTGKTVYIQSSTPNVTIEIEAWV